MAVRGPKTYRVRVGDRGPQVEVSSAGWLKAADEGAQRLGVSRREVQVEVDKKVGFVSPNVVTH